MDGRTIVIYILLILFYVISRALKSKKKPTLPPISKPQDYEEADMEEPMETPKPFSKPGKGQPVTFEDLLKEFTGYEQEKAQPTVEPPVARDFPSPVYIPQDIVKNEPVYSHTTAEIEFHKPVEESPHFSYDDLYKGPEKMVKADSAPVDLNKNRFGQYASYKSYDIHTAERFRNLLSNPTTLKDAIILKEILDTRYF